MSDEPPFRTRSGRVLTDAEIQALADEAERGYDVDPARGRVPDCANCGAPRADHVERSVTLYPGHRGETRLLCPGQPGLFKAKLNVG